MFAANVKMVNAERVLFRGKAQNLFCLSEQKYFKPKVKAAIKPEISNSSFAYLLFIRCS